MSEQAKTELDGTPSGEAPLEPADLNDSELENVSGGSEGGNMEVQQDGGGNGTADID